MIPRILPDILLGLAEFEPGLPLLRYRRQEGYATVTAREFLGRTLALAAGLEKLGIGPGDRVALISENRPEWSATDFATLLLGAVTVPLYPTLPGPQCGELLAHSGAAIVVASTAMQLNKLMSIAADLPNLRHLIVMDPPEPIPESVIGWNDLIRTVDSRGTADPDPWVPRLESIGPGDLASIIYTSGTTGTPKGVMLTHSNFCSNVVSASEAIPIRRGDTLLSYLPLSHVFERTVDFICFYRGATIAYATLGDTLMDDFRATRPTVVPTVPRILEKIRDGVRERAAGAPAWRRILLAWSLAIGRRSRQEIPDQGSMPFWVRGGLKLARRLVLDPLRNRLVGPQFRFFVSGAAPLPLEVGAFFASAGMSILQGYGLTETSPVITVNRPNRNRLGTVGPTIDGVEVRVLEDGEVATRGPNVMKGYYRNEAATREVLRDGWFHTGDIGQVDRNGFLSITDRKKDLIKTSGGKMIAPQPLESRLRGDSLISEAIIIGDGRKFISALVVPDFGRLERFLAREEIAVEDMSQALQHPRVQALYERRIARRLKGCAPFETVKRFQLLHAPLTQENGELTPTQKVRRSRIAEKFSREIEAMYG
jgi:long-chain acyl-CoA synthetase